jgi:hypothetical protein
VVHQGLQVGDWQPDGHQYWKMRISSIHQDKAGNLWVVGSWFYSPSDLEKSALSTRCVLYGNGRSSPCFKESGSDKSLISRMGNSELVESDHTDVIEAACIEGVCSHFN